MKNISKGTALIAAVFMFFCITGCGNNAGGSPTPTPEPPFVAEETPLTLEAIEDGLISLARPEKMTNLKFKKNGGNFVSVTASMNTIFVAAGDKIAFYADGSANTYNSSTGYIAFKIDSYEDCFVYGNVMSLWTHQILKTLRLLVRNVHLVVYSVLILI